MKEGYKSIEEIIQEVAEEEGWSMEEVNDVWEHQKHYIKKQMDTEGVYAIFLPFIGTLSLNMKQFKREVKGKLRRVYQDFINKAESLLKHEGYRKYLNSHKKTTGVNRLARKIIRDYDTGHERTQSLLPHHQCWDIIAKHSNGNYEKREEKLTRNKNESTEANS